MDERVRQRVKLWLRSEAAMGQPSLPVALPRPAVHPPPTPTRPQTPRSSLPPRPAAAPPPPPADGLLLPPRPDAGPFTAPLLPREQRIAALEAMDRDEVKGCTRCRLCQTRTKTVFGEGDPEARILFIGEGPGENEDLTGRPFVGRAGELLDRMIKGMGLKREQVFIANLVKCRPPGNRVPLADEVATCTGYLVRQLEIIRPKVIVTLGLPAVKFMLDNERLAMGRIRGQWQTWRGIPLMPTYHPAYILRQYTDAVRAAVWDDLKKVMASIGMAVPARKKSDT